MALRKDNMGQCQALPTSIKDLIPDDHICNLVIAVIKCMDLSKIEERYMDTPGNPAYPRRMLLKSARTGSPSKGIFSSRKITKLCHENVIYMYLTGNEKPDHRTICRFRKDNRELIEEVFKKTITIARAAGILKLGHLSSDGTKIKANASNNYTLSEEELKEIRNIIEKGIKIDEEEDKLYGERRGDELPPELNTQEKIRKKIEEIEESRGKRLKRASKRIIKKHTTGNEKEKNRIEEKLNKAEEEIEKSGQKAVSITDPESRFMENKKKRNELSYNPQITVDHDSGIIVANDVTQDCTDHNQLQPQVEKTEENLGDLPEGVGMSFDNGYFSGSNLRYLEGKGLDGYIPDSKQTQKAKGKKIRDNPYSKDKFEYDEDQDCFTCPEGEVLTRKGAYERDNKMQYAYYGADCRNCPHRQACVGKAGGRRVITSDGFEAERRRMRGKMQTEEGGEEYKKRGESVEWVFGNIKQNLGLREFLTRGVERVRCEWNLVCTAHNLKVMWGKLRGNVGVLCEIWELGAGSAFKTGKSLSFHPILGYV